MEKKIHSQRKKKQPVCLIVAKAKQEDLIRLNLN